MSKNGCFLFNGTLDFDVAVGILPFSGNTSPLIVA
jgi:hypothetical protein